LLELLRQEVEDRRLIAIVSDRGDGDLHPIHVDVDVLAARQVAVSGRTWVMLDEVHGTAVRRAVARDRSSGDAVAGVGDVLVGEPGTAVAVWVADCAPVVLFDRAGTTVACHAGWRGLAAGVINVAVDQLEEPCAAAVLGPCIHPCCYEFGAVELAEVAVGLDVGSDAISGRTSSGALALDVPAAVAVALGRHGIALDTIGPCTGCDDRWYSHRRGDPERQAVVAWSEVAR
jgi:copper oxidase (laccase) domain-containing protein